MNECEATQAVTSQVKKFGRWGKVMKHLKPRSKRDGTYAHVVGSHSVGALLLLLEQSCRNISVGCSHLRARVKIIVTERNHTLA
jgi:hypothetical protein